MGIALCVWGGGSCDREIQAKKKKKAACAMGLRISVVVILCAHWDGVMRQCQEQFSKLPLGAEGGTSTDSLVSGGRITSSVSVATAWHRFGAQRAHPRLSGWSPLVVCGTQAVHPHEAAVGS